MTARAKLTKGQIEHLRALSAGERSSYPGLRLGTLNSLDLKGLVSARYELGSTAWPANAIFWSLTPAGRAALEARDAKAD